MNSSHQSPLQNTNRGISFDLDWVMRVNIDVDGIEKKARSLAAAAAVRKESQGSLLRAIACTDLTTLSPDDTDDRVRRLCVKARQPLPLELIKRVGHFDGHRADLRVAAVCVYQPFIKLALRELEGTDIQVATVSADFPKGLAPLEDRIAQIHRSVEEGADEIDVVIKRAHVLEGNWQSLYDEVAAFKAACSPRHMKVILATGELENLDNIARASLVTMMAGADFIKTSTGKEVVNATLPSAIVMTRAIREYANKTGVSIGFKPAGGIRTARHALEYMSVVREELGEQWLHPNLFRIGASSMLDDIELELEQLLAN